MGLLERVVIVLEIVWFMILMIISGAVLAESCEKGVFDLVAWAMVLGALDFGMFLFLIYLWRERR